VNAISAPGEQQSKTRRRWLIGGGFALLSAFCFATLPIFAKGAYAGGLEVLDALSLRFLIAAGALWVYALSCRDVPLLPSRRHLGALAVLGAGIYGSLAICFFLSVQRLPASLAEMIFFVYPLLVTVLSIPVLQERFTWQRGLALALGLVGCYFLLDVRLAGWDLEGALWALAAAVLYAVHITASQKLLERVEPRVSALYVVTFAAVFFTVLRPPWVALAHLTMPLMGLISVAGLGLVATAMSMLSFFLAVERIGSWRTAVIGVCEPVGAVVLASLFLGEMLSAEQLAGGVLILVAALLVHLVQLGVNM
jgi:drug/metabolite transporter (DMT)-like permease